MSTPPADAEALAAARVLLQRLGVDPHELLSDNPASATNEVQDRRPGKPMPTIAQWITVVEGLVSPSTATSYGTYWRKASEAWGQRPLDEVTASDIKALGEKIKITAVVRQNSRGGTSAQENFVAAMRCLYKYAEADELIDERNNPARRVTKPRRKNSTRRALPSAQLSELNETIASTGNDPELDGLILRLHEETACRRGGALALRPRDLDPQQCLILLREKGGTFRWQPVSPTLMRHLQHHVDSRGSGNTDEQLLRYANGDPITTRRYDHIFVRARRNLPWAERSQISVHWIRYTTLTWVERNFGYAVARAFAGHTDKSDGSTTTYVQATITEIATALSALTGEPHPLADDPYA